MALPTFDAFCRPVLEVLALHDGALDKSTLFARVAEAARLSPEDREARIGSGQSTFENRVGWACSWMKHAGYVENPSRARWAITAPGRKRLQQGTLITAAELRPFADPRARAQRGAGSPGGSDASSPASSLLSSGLEQTPDERIDEAVADIKRELQADLSERLSNVSATFSEQTVLRLLKAMGYAGALGRAEHSGRSGDGGIDGILYLDRLGLERVYVQAKRWEGSVGAPTVRDFAGAMDVVGATKGVVLTTSRFSAEARQYTQRSPKAIRLIDGEELASLMIEFAVGVSHERVVVLPKLDRDFFDD